ncbi:MAG TPA: hypothetical protein VMF03_07485 [Steroidobacteraceae bacterium]|nr:hypothetical protein [Steroidobacteraceae bacterium]
MALGCLAVASLMITVPARAGCMNPRSAAAQRFVGPHGKWGSGHALVHTIVGTWHVTYSLQGAPFAEAFIQWHSDGTEWENINLPILDGTLCLGSWNESGKDQFTRNHYGWLYDGAGNLTGYFQETETDLLSKDGSSYSGTFDQTSYDLDGNVIAGSEATGTASADRLGP